MVTKISLLIFAAYLLAGCFDSWAGLEPGMYTVAREAGAANAVALSEIQKLEIDRNRRLAVFTLLDGTGIVVSFIPRDRNEWPSGCPTNINSTRMEVLDFEEERLDIGAITFNNPVLVRDCPPNPMSLVLREDGVIGGGTAACTDRDRCVFFAPDRDD